MLNLTSRGTGVPALTRLAICFLLVFLPFSLVYSDLFGARGSGAVPTTSPRAEA